ncbi:hypothetical protein [Rhodoferax sp. GW822-FHT02A01]|uniref:hypothetical protein n=1 Tax=Rhodoferax sp. GW822-FHT02A01 TaxID=3141537 RepID=UPI00315CCF4B
MRSSRFMVLLFAALALLAFAAQFAIDFSEDNIAANCLVLASSLAILLYILWTDAIQTHPLSTFAIFGFCVTTQLGALLAQSAYWTPLAQNLRQPVETFATLAFYQSIAIAAHGLYRVLSTFRGKRQSTSLVRSTLQSIGLYDTPSAGTLWVMGVFGLLNLLMAGGAGIASKVAQGFSFAVWAPFLIPMYVLEQGSSYCNARKNYFFLGAYVLLIAAIAIAINARSLMLAGLMTIALFGILSAMRSHHKVRASQVGKIALVILLCGVATIPLSELVTAMGLARGARANAGPMKMIEETLYYLSEPQLLRAEQDRTKHISLNSNYDETYFSSSLIGRLVETKFHDNALYFASRLSDRDEARLLDLTTDLFWSTLPDPMLKAMSIGVDKQELRFSMGDYLSYLAGSGDLGGYKTGSHLGQGQAVFGVAYPVVYFFLCLLLFICVDVLAYRNAQGGMWISALGMLGIWRMFQYGISAESLHFLFMSIVRGLPQNLALYLLIYYLSRAVARFLAQLTGVTTQGALALR